MSQNKNVLYSTNMSPLMVFVREGEDPPAPAAPTPADLQKAIDAAVAAATAGLKTKNDELLGKLKDTTTKLKDFDGIDPAKIREIQQRLDHDEDIKLFSEGKKIEVINKYTERMRAEHQAQLDQAEERVRAEAERANAYRGAVLDNQIRSVAQGLHKSAIEDALLHARQIFSLDAKGNAVQMDADGRPVLGKDGKTPFTPAEWIELQKELKPHWFPNGTSGSGSGGAREAGSTGKTIKRADFDRLPATEQRAAAIAGVQIID